MSIHLGTATPPDHGLASPRDWRWRLSPLNAAELFEALTALPGAKSVRANGKVVAASTVIGGVEVAHATVIDERALRRAWRDRTKGGPVPLLLVVDDPDRDGGLRALGPLGPEDPVRLLEAGDL